MIQKGDIIPMLLAACPGFKSAWEEHLRYWQGEEAGIYIDTAEFVHYLVEVYEKGERETLSAAFEVVERLIVEGTEEVRGAAIVGVLETLQCVASHSPYGEGVFLPYLGTKSLEAWAELERIWEGKGSLADVIRAELKVDKNY